MQSTDSKLVKGGQIDACQQLCHNTLSVSLVLFLARSLSLSFKGTVGGLFQPLVLLFLFLFPHHLIHHQTLLSIPNFLSISKFSFSFFPSSFASSPYSQYSLLTVMKLSACSSAFGNFSVSGSIALGVGIVRPSKNLLLENTFMCRSIKSPTGQMVRERY